MPGILDIFHSDPFRTIELTTAVEKVPYVPDGLEGMGIFTDKPIRTEALMVEQRQGVLVIVPTTDRGAPGTQRTTELRQARGFKVPRLKMEDTVFARELAGIREFGQETVLMQVQSEVSRRLVGPMGLRTHLALTQEYHKLAAVQGKLLDANGSVIYNWFNEFGITANAEVVFSLPANTARSLRPICNQLTRAMRRKSQGGMTQRSRVKALCGDAFFDALITHQDVEKTYLNWYEAKTLRDGMAFETFTFADIDWINYRGVDTIIGIASTSTNGSGVIPIANTAGLAAGDPVTGPGVPAASTVGSISANTSVTLAGAVTCNAGAGAGVFNFGTSSNSVVSIPANQAIFFPSNTVDVFQRALAPADTIEWVNQLGKPEYVQMIPDRDRQEWVKFEMSVYPLHICTRPEVLFTGTMDSISD